jgi:tetratricopeptide (TPR) repeat protein
MRLLTGGPRTAPRRQQTLRATLDWSYQLLSEPERMLLRRLAVFAGGWTLEAAEAVCAVAGGGPAAEEVLDLLGRLVGHSLVLVEDAAGVARYQLLETVRQYGAERLAESGEQVDAERRHAAYYVALAEEAEARLTGAEQTAWLAQLEREHDNLRAVLRRTHERGEQEVGLRVAGAVWRFWDVRGYVSEGRNWLEGLLAGVEAQTPVAAASAIRVKALNGAGVLAETQGDYARAQALHEGCLALCRELGDERGSANSLSNLGNVARRQGDYARARALHEEGLALRRALGDKNGLAGSLANLGNAADEQGDYARARALHEDSLALRRELCDKRGMAIALNNLGNVANAQGDYTLAGMYYEESLTLCRELGDRRRIASSLSNLGNAVQKQRDYARAWALQEESLHLCRELGDKQGMAFALTNLGSVAYMQGEYARARVLHEESLALFWELGDKNNISEILEELARPATAPGTAPEILLRAVRLFGAAAALREAIGTHRRPDEVEGCERATVAMRAAVGESAYKAAWAEGQAMPLEEAVALALSGPAAVG